MNRVEARRTTSAGATLRRVGAALAVGLSSVFVAAGVAATPAGATQNPMVESWGDNTYGQLGNGTTTGSSTPIPVSLPGGVAPVSVAAGEYHSLAIGSDGNLYAWGQNGYGQLGNGTTVQSDSPVMISLPGGVHPTAVAAGAASSEALASNGKVYAWGDNSFGELGDGSTSSSLTPVAVSLPTTLTFTKIAAGQFHSLALASNGALYAWGYNNDGQLGDGNKVTPTTPVHITLPGGATPTQIAAGGYHSLAIGTTGNVYAWGYNLYGQLGDGTTTDRRLPVVTQTPAGVPAVSIAAGLYHSVMIGANGSVYAWGYNGNGELGNNTDVNSSTPVKSLLPSGASATAVAGSVYNSYALASGGTLYAWGQNGFGQLGNGTTVSQWVPITVNAPPNATFTGLMSDSMSDFALAIVTPTQSVTTTTLSASSTSPVYGQADTLTATVTGSDGGGTVAFKDGSSSLGGCAAVSLTPSGPASQAQCTTSTLSAGQHNLTAVYSGDTSSLGGSSPASVVNVAQAPLSVTASSAAVTYATAPPAITPSYSGFVNGDSASSLTATPTCTTSATPTSPVGTYPTSCSGASAANYSISYQSGQIAVDPAPLSISASSASMTYGGAVPAVTPTYSGFVNGDSASSLTTPPSCTTTATSSSPVGSYPSSCTGASDPNYAISYSGGNVVVGAAPLVITASSDSTTYGTPASAITPSYSGFLNGDTASSLTTQATCTTTAAVNSPVGAYPSSCSGASDPNYAISYVGGTVTVDPAPLTVTASSGNMTYGDSAPTVSPLVTGLENGEGASVLGGGLHCSTGATSTTPVGIYSASCSGASDPNYAITYVGGTVSIDPAPVAVTASSGTMTYGGSVPAIHPTVVGLQNGEDMSVLGSGFGCTTTAASTSPVGSYDSSCSGASDPNYAVSYLGGTVTVTPAQLSITASSGTMTYGGSVPAITPTVTGLQNGEDITVLGPGLLCSTSADSSSPVGTYASICTGATDPNYTITDVEGSITVAPAALIVTASSEPVDYGTAPPSIAASYTGFANGDTAASLTTAPSCSTTATASSPVGSYDSSCSGASDPNYAITYVDGSVVVGPAALIVVASDGSMTYGGSVPTVTPTYEGLVNGDTAASLTTAPSCSTTATASSPVGSYDSSCSGALDPNYNISYVDGAVTVSPAPLTVTASSASTVYGGASPDITPSYSGFVGGDTTASLTTPATCSSPVVATTGVGTFTSSCSGASDPNYTITYADGSVTVSPAPLTVTASSATSNYGSPVPSITSSISGLQNGEAASVLGSGLTCSTTATATSPVGSYPTSCSGAVDANYTISYGGGSLTVEAAALTVQASSGSFTYGGSAPPVTPTITGLVNGEPASVLGPLTCSTGADSSSSAGTYPSVCSGATDPDYAITYVAGSVQVLSAPLSVAASSGSMTYGAAAPAITPTYAGFVNGDTASSLDTAPTCATTATSNSPVGTYRSSCSGASDPNYTVSYVDGSVVVGASTLVISASSGTMTYGGAAPAVTPTYSGFVNGDTPASLTTPPTCTAGAGSSSAVGSYAATCAGASDPNYTITYVSGSVHVTPAPLTVAASSATVTYGGATPSIHPTVSGLVNGDSVGSLGAGLACSTTVGPTSPVGSYSSTCSGASDPNYTIGYASGTVTVGPATLSVTANNQTMQFGGSVPTLTDTITGFVNGQNLATSGVTGSPVCTTTATSTSAAGNYPITCSPGTLAATDYVFSFVSGTLTITNTVTVCNTSGQITITAGESVRIAPGCTVAGSITVAAGGSLDAEGAVVHGSLVSTGGSLRECSTRETGDLDQSGSTSPTVIGDGTTSCPGSVLLGSVSLVSNSGSVSFQNNQTHGGVQIQNNTGGVVAENNQASGNFTVLGNSGTVVDRPNSIKGSSQLQ